MKQSDDAITFTVKKIYLYVAIAVVVGFGGGFGLARALFSSGATDENLSTLEQTSSQQAQIGADDTTGSAPQQAASMQVLIEGRPFRGKADAPVTLVEFTDYQCPFCGRHFRETLPQLLDEYEDSVKFVILNFPLSSIHPFAQKASEAAECAYDQGKFWEYHDNLFENQAALDTASLKTYAEEIGLDSDVFNACLDSGTKVELVLGDFRDGQSFGVTGTPTFFINGQRVVGAQPFSAFQTLIDTALNR